MNKLSIYALGLAMGAMTLTSCEDMFGDFLDKQPSSDLTKEDVVSDFTTLVYNHNDTYNFLRHGAQRINSSWLDAATDLAECAIGTSGTRTTFNVGNYYGEGGSNELVSTWESYYRAIRKCNTTIEVLEADTDNKLRPSDTNLETYTTQKNWYISEARFLRAYFYWELFLRYGPVPLVKTTLDPNGDLLTSYSERPSTTEFLNYVLSEVQGCEANLMDYATSHTTDNCGEVDQPTARALYVRMMLYMASPRYSSTTGVTWAQAANAAKQWLDDFGGNFALCTTASGESAYTNSWLLNAYTENNPEIIWFRNDAAIGWSGISTDQPVGEGGSGGLCPSQNLVDMYDMADGSAPFASYDATGAPIYNSNGQPTVNSASGYSDAKMWENRDPRLASTVLYHGCTWGYTTTTKTNVIDVTYGGRDNPVGNQNATPTGYYVRKYQPQTILASNHGGTSRRLWRIFTYSEMLLNYAEALNEADFAGNYETVCGLLDQIRHRGGITGNVADRLDLDNQNAMRNFIHKERTIELAFEEHRWWDVRRWNVAGDALGRNIYGVEVASNGAITRKVAQKRTWQDRFYLYPIPEEEVWKIGQDFQNEGW